MTSHNLDLHKCLPNYRRKGFPVSLNCQVKFSDFWFGLRKVKFPDTRELPPADVPRGDGNTCYLRTPDRHAYSNTGRQRCFQSSYDEQVSLLLRPNYPGSQATFFLKRPSRNTLTLRATSTLSWLSKKTGLHRTFWCSSRFYQREEWR
jgi:hypothetical protein